MNNTDKELEKLGVSAVKLNNLIGQVVEINIGEGMAADNNFKYKQEVHLGDKILYRKILDIKICDQPNPCGFDVEFVFNEPITIPLPELSQQLGIYVHLHCFHAGFHIYPDLDEVSVSRPCWVRLQLTPDLMITQKSSALYELDSYLAVNGKRLGNAP